MLIFLLCSLYIRYYFFHFPELLAWVIMAFYVYVPSCYVWKLLESLYLNSVRQIENCIVIR